MKVIFSLHYRILAPCGNSQEHFVTHHHLSFPFQCLVVFPREDTKEMGLTNLSNSVYIEMASQPKAVAAFPLYYCLSIYAVNKMHCITFIIRCKFVALPLSYDACLLHYLYHTMHVCCITFIIRCMFVALPLSYDACLLHYFYHTMHVRCISFIIRCMLISI